MGKFARSAACKEPADHSLGNVMGLNPFHDFSAWSALKAPQEIPLLQAFEVPALDVKEEMDAWITAAKATAGI
ncbi:hypothetical protein NPS29_00960 [Pseudomonas putida]|uniref:hypothetical protein n=1 Tax=Pseudomonas putida TaxID=303 RepID=UPI002363A8CA|nr:hypothetical protein [Pseudomonas putida]MDD1963879.1 hypothetical protein [Pseudomonas putida]